MKNKFFAAIALLSLLASCTPPAGGPVEGPTWKLVYMNGEIPEGLDISATFKDGKLTGKGACNQYFADYEIDKGALKVGPVGATKMMCPQHATLESQYFGALPKAQTFSVKGETLSITTEEAELQFVKGKESTETSWAEQAQGKTKF